MLKQIESRLVTEVKALRPTIMLTTEQWTEMINRANLKGDRVDPNAIKIFAPTESLAHGWTEVTIVTKLKDCTPAVEGWAPLWKIWINELTAKAKRLLRF